MAKIGIPIAGDRKLDVKIKNTIILFWVISTTAKTNNMLLYLDFSLMWPLKNIYIRITSKPMFIMQRTMFRRNISEFTKLQL